MIPSNIQKRRPLEKLIAVSAWISLPEAKAMVSLWEGTEFFAVWKTCLWMPKTDADFSRISLQKLESGNLGAQTSNKDWRKRKIIKNIWARGVFPLASWSTRVMEGIQDQIGAFPPPIADFEEFKTWKLISCWISNSEKKWLMIQFKATGKVEVDWK